ncbi:uncharacterized protein [Watersipora subatra]|uniref:uncharacterized protein n=1 Tax=Watersipora subatra TaxID=2589382 RepID=UPI00355C399F
MDSRVLLIIGALVAGCFARSCYNCVDCERDENMKIDCTIISSSDSCYATYDKSNDRVSKSCGADELDQYNFKNGCTKRNGATICRCRSDYCNTDSLISSSPNFAASFALVLFGLLVANLF